MESLNETMCARGPAGPYFYHRNTTYVYPDGKRDCPSDLRYRQICASGALSDCDYAVMYLLCQYGPMTAEHVRCAMGDTRIPAELKLGDERGEEYTKNPYSKALKRLDGMGLLESGRFYRKRGDGTNRELFKAYSVPQRMMRRVTDSAVGHYLSMALPLGRCGFSQTTDAVRMLEHLSALTLRIYCELHERESCSFRPYSPEQGTMLEGVLSGSGMSAGVLSVRRCRESTERLRNRLQNGSAFSEAERLLLVLETKEMYPELRRLAGITDEWNGRIIVTNDGEAHRSGGTTYWKMIDGAMCTVEPFGETERNGE